MSKQLFFSRVRESFGPLTPGQVEGLNILVAATSQMPLEHRAYILATAWHETGPEDSQLHMRPRVELGGKSYFNQYDAGTEKGAKLGNTSPGDGYKFRGRGYVQLTGRRNYLVASLATKCDLIARPDDALAPALAALIMVNGMTEGWFTTKKLSDYSRYIEMRRVVNGMDKAADIAGYAARFEHALRGLKDALETPPSVFQVDLKPEFPPPMTTGTPPSPVDQLDYRPVPMRAQTWREWLNNFFR